MESWYEQRVRERAYEIWQKAGCPEGASAEHWLQAEAEITAEERARTGNKARERRCCLTCCWRRQLKGIKMTTKSNFTREEWGRLLASPMVVGMSGCCTDPSGLWGLVKERLAFTRSIIEAHQKPYALVQAVAQDLATREGTRAAHAAIRACITGEQVVQLKDTALAELRAISCILHVKAPEHATVFKAWLHEVAQTVAEAGNEGGFLGFTTLR